MAAIPDLSVSSVSSVSGGDTSATLTLAFSGDFGTPATLGVTVRAATRFSSTDLTTGKRVRVELTDTTPNLGSTNANRGTYPLVLDGPPTRYADGWRGVCYG